jgi:hypothetical protein
MATVRSAGSSTSCRRSPRGAIENEISVTVGSEDTARLGFGSGGALTPELAYRLDVSGNYSGGWVDRGRNRTPPSPVPAVAAAR